MFVLFNFLFCGRNRKSRFCIRLFRSDPQGRQTLADGSDGIVFRGYRYLEIEIGSEPEVANGVENRVVSSGAALDGGSANPSARPVSKTSAMVPASGTQLGASKGSDDPNPSTTIVSATKRWVRVENSEEEVAVKIFKEELNKKGYGLDYTWFLLAQQYPKVFARLTNELYQQTPSGAAQHAEDAKRFRTIRKHIYSNEYDLLMSIPTHDNIVQVYHLDEGRHGCARIYMELLTRELFEVIEEWVQNKWEFIGQLDASQVTETLKTKDAGQYETTRQIYMSKLQQEFNRPDIAQYFLSCARKSKTIFKQIILAVAHLHANGVVHLDLKPSNMMFKEENNFNS